MSDIADVLKALSPPVSMLDLIEQQQAKHGKMSEQALNFAATWRKINAGESVPVIDQFEAPSTEDNLAPDKALDYINNAEKVAQQTLNAQAALAKAIAVDKHASAALREAEEALKDGEAEALLEDVDSDLVGDDGKPYAKTSDERKHAIRLLLKKAHEGSLKELVKDRDKLKKEAHAAEIEVSQRTHQFKALCTVATIHGNILAALSA